MKNDHDHNCFREAEQKAMELEDETGDRVGYFIFVGTGQVGDAHYLGNTAFAGSVFMRLVKDVVTVHQIGKCEHCDRVALALAGARATFMVLMEDAGSCR